MADKKVSDLPSLNGADVDPADLLYIVDSSAGAAGSKKITVGQYQLAPVSGGTANTVVYLNGSKVESSSSALTFDGTNFATTGTSSAAKLIPTGGTATGNGMYLPAANTLAWSNNGAETMRLDTSGNLGIGTSSPLSKLHVNGDIRTDGDIDLIGGAGTPEIRMYQNSGNWAIQNSAGNLLFYDMDAAATRVTVDGSGNLGLGVTPSAWQAGAKAVEIGNNGYLAFTGNAVGGYLYSNAYFTGTNTYKANGFAAAYGLGVSGQHIWYTAPSGTAGNAITFTQAMTLSASSELNIDSGTGGGRLTFTPGNTNNTISSTTTGFSGYNILRYRGTQHQWLDSAGTQAMTLDASSNLTLKGNYIIDDTGTGIVSAQGTGASSLALNGRNAILFTTGGTPSGTERARITSGGDLLVGTTSALTGFTQARLTISGTTGFVAQTTAATNEAGAFWNAATAGDNVFVLFGTETTHTLRGTITYNRAGGLTAYNTTSDYRAKDIIGPVQNPGATIDALKVYEGVMKGATQSRPMLIAHEAQEHAPYAVSGVKDEVNEDGTPKFQQMDVSSLVPLLLAEIQSLRARVAALEAK